jgi:hypothetical protein
VLVHGVRSSPTTTIPEGSAELLLLRRGPESFSAEGSDAYVSWASAFRSANKRLSTWVVEAFEERVEYSTRKMSFPEYIVRPIPDRGGMRCLVGGLEHLGVWGSCRPIRHIQVHRCHGAHAFEALGRFVNLFWRALRPPHIPQSPGVITWAHGMELEPPEPPRAAVMAPRDYLAPPAAPSAGGGASSQSRAEGQGSTLVVAPLHAAG